MMYQWFVLTAVYCSDTTEKSFRELKSWVTDIHGVSPLLRVYLRRTGMVTILIIVPRYPMLISPPQTPLPASVWISQSFAQRTVAGNGRSQTEYLAGEKH